MFKLTALVLKPSLYLAILLLVIHGGGIVVLLNLDLSIWLKLSLVFVCLINLFYAFYRHVIRRDPKAIIKLWPIETNMWQLQDNRGQVWTARLCNDSVCTLYCLLLNFRIVNKRDKRTVIIFPDSLDAVTFRRLRVVLKN